MTGTPEKTVPSLQTLYDEGIKDLRRALFRVQSTENAETAKAAVGFALNVGWHLVSRLELIRAIEARLPAPSLHQKDRCSLLRLTKTDEIIYSRVIGAFGENVIMLTPNPADNHLPPIIRILTIPADGESPIPDWDVTCPESRRTAPTAIIDAEARKVSLA